VQPATFAQQGDAEGVVEFGVGRNDAFDGHMADPRRRAGRQGSDLIADIGRGVEEKPPGPVGRDGGRGLAPRMGSPRLGSGDSTGGAPAVPLGEPAAGGSAEEDYLHTKGNGARDCREPRPVRRDLEGRDVCGDFHRHSDDFGFGLGPGHVELRKVRVASVGSKHPVRGRAVLTTPPRMQALCRSLSGALKVLNVPVG
jgi:hypothetical protein